MRLPLLTLVLGILVGFAAHSFVSDHPQWYFNFAQSKPSVPEVIFPPSVGPTKPMTYQSSEKTLARLKKRFDEAVVVVLADESYDDDHNLVRVSVLDVWKGPADLTGKRMDTALLPPMSYTHPTGKQRVLKFMPMTPHLDTNGTVYFEGEALRMNPAFTIGTLKEALVNRQTSNEVNHTAEPTSPSQGGSL